MRKGKNGIYSKYIKRILDIICALAAIIVFFWLYAIVAVLVKIKIGSPVIFKQPRPGKDTKIFYLYKFRTMTDFRDENGNLLPDEKRLTAFGRSLRASSLDELPEVWNILRGDMSVIGPRPQLVRDMVFMNSEQMRRHEIKPGLSGLAQVMGRNALEWEHKLEADIEYLENMSFWLDLMIVCKTVKQVFFRRKGILKSDIDEVDLTDDFGDYLVKEKKISESEYYEKQLQAKKILGEQEKSTLKI